MRRPYSPFVLLLAGLFLLALATAVGAADISREEMLRLGERLYRQGILPSGEPVQAVVQGDIPVDGTMFSCESCHLRSGLGSVEGQVITLPTNGRELYKPFTKAAEEVNPGWAQVPDFLREVIRRPAYTDESLARAIWNGVDPAGREFNLSMPRYFLDPPDMEILVHYLKNLNAEFSPGVDAVTLRFATVIAGDVPPRQREAMLSVLQTHVRNVNAQSRRQEERAKKAPFYKQKMLKAWRRWSLEVWELTGAAETWPAQLDAHYRRQPVFALLGGLAAGPWDPVHRWCEAQRIPCILPVTEYPVIAEGDWYTFYFSKGLYQEGETAARYLRALPTPPGTIIQAWRAGSPAGEAMARGFRETWTRLGQPPPQELSLPAAGDPVLPPLDDATLLLWLGPEDAPFLERLTAASGRPGRLFLAAGLWQERLAAVPEAARPFTYLTWPWRLPEDAVRSRQVVRSWLRVQKLPETDFDIQGRMYFLGWFVNNVLMMVQSDFYRDYFLDDIDMMNDETYAIAAFPRLSFGQGQRYAAKGCYVVQLSAGDNPRLLPKSDWVIH